MLLKATLTILFLVLLTTPDALRGVGSSVAKGQTLRKQAKAVTKVNRYSCPMHPEVNSTRRGKCKQCGMTLRLVQPEARPTPEPVSSALLTTDSDQNKSIPIPDVDVYDQNGKRLRFRTDLIKGKTVAINFIFTTCTTLCPPLTATFRRLQQELAAQNLPVELISISVDPTTDTPARLKEFAAKFKAGPGWTFVTGDKTAIDSILRALGVAVADKTDHTPMILIGNDARDSWTRAYGLSSPSTLLKAITEAANRK